VIGIVAGRIKEKSGKPAVVIALECDDAGNGKGSGRSIAGVDLGAAVIAAREAGMLKAGGGHGGQNGVRSTIDHIGPDFLRVRVGVGRPAGQKDTAVHVLEPFTKVERETVPNLVADAAGAVESIVLEGLAKAQLRYHSPS
jgi:hypothetical protein